MENKDMMGIKEIDKAIEPITKQRELLREEVKSLETSREVLFKVNDLCPDCEGRGYYYRDSTGDDPYERSSDLREKCQRCKGTGKYIKI